MISIKDFTEAVQYKITGGAEYQWQCFGPNARFLESDGENYSTSIVFDTITQEVYVGETWDYTNDRQYRLINQNYLSALRDECKTRNHAFDESIDGAKFIDLETDTDWIEKTTAIRNGKVYDTRISIPLDIPEDELLKIFMAAHERDMTFNDFVTMALQVKIDELKAQDLLRKE